jgi:hypothetical protein
MHILIVKGARRATLAVHKIESDTDMQELLEAYRALGYESEALIVVDAQEEKAA